jgi:hypothetical protein
MVNVEEEHTDLFGHPLPVLSISLPEPPEDVLEGGRDKEVLLLDHQLLNAERLARVLRVWSTSNLLALLPCLYDVLVLVHLGTLLLESWQSCPQAHRDCIESIVASVLGVVCHGAYLLGVNPLTPSDLKPIVFLLLLDDSALHLNMDCKVEALHLQRIFGEIFFLSAALLEGHLTLWQWLTLLHLLQVAVLVAEAVAPSRQLERSQ